MASLLNLDKLLSAKRFSLVKFARYKDWFPVDLDS